MDAVMSFNQELSALYDVKPPISKAKMTALTRGAIKAIKFYKHVVQSVEKFILKCKPDYKVPGLYVIDSIVRQSRHQFGPDKDVFAPRFSKNIHQTFVNLFNCPPEDKSKIIRVLNLWQKNQVFPPEVIQPLFDHVDPNNPIHKELATAPAHSFSNGLIVSTDTITKGSPATQRTLTKESQPGHENTHASSNLVQSRSKLKSAGSVPNIMDPNVLQQLQQLQRLLTKNSEGAVRADSQVHFDKNLLDFDYGDDDEDIKSPRPVSNNTKSDVTSLLTNPEILRHLQTLQTLVGGQSDMDIDKLEDMKQQEEEFDKSLAQTVPKLPCATECDFKSNSNEMVNYTGTFYTDGINNTASQYESSRVDSSHQQANKNTNHDKEAEAITVDQGDSRPEYKYSRQRSRSKSRDCRSGRDKDRGKDRKRRSTSISSRRYRSRSRDRGRTKDKVKEKEKGTEKNKERKKRGLPAIKKDHLSVYSTTLWVGHLSKLVHQDDLSNTFGEFGNVVSIDFIPPRGCAFIVMLRRHDAARCLGKLKGHMLHSKAITLAWAPGKGVKGKDFKEYWEGDLGVTYIPYNKLHEDINLELLEDGGMIDEDTMPAWMKEKKTTPAVEIPSNSMIGDIINRVPEIDTSQPPPLPGGLLQHPPMMPLVNPFHFNNRLLDMNMMHNMPNIPNMPNVPLGVPPPNMPGALMQNQLLSIGSPFQVPPRILLPQLEPAYKQNPPPDGGASLHSATDLIHLNQQNYHPVAPPLQDEDVMEIDMEDAQPTKKISSFKMVDRFRGKSNDRRDRRQDDRDRRDDRNRRNRSRYRDCDRNRGKDQQSSMDRDLTKSRDLEVTHGRRDRSGGSNRWGDKDRDKDRRYNRDTDQDKRFSEKNLKDRLREMAGIEGFDDGDRNTGRSSRERRDSSARPVFQAPPHDDYSRGSQGGREYQRNSAPARESGNATSTSPSEEKKPTEQIDKATSESTKVQPPGEGTSEKTNGNNTVENPSSEMGGEPLEGPPDSFEGHGDAMDETRYLRLPHRPSHIIDGPPEEHIDDQVALIEGPPDTMMDIPPRRMRDGPPHRMDGPPHGPLHPHMMGGGTPQMMMTVDPMMMDGPLMIDGPPRFRSPRRRGIRRPPPPGWGPRGGFPMSRGPNFGPRGSRAGPLGCFFGPRGPRGPFRVFNRFDGPPNYFMGLGVGPGLRSFPRMQPPMFDRPSGRTGRRSRWGGDSPSRNEDAAGQNEE